MIGAFTAKLAYCRNLICQEEPNIPETEDQELNKTVLIAAGSATPVTKRQMEVLCQDKRVKRIPVDPVLLIDGGQEGLAEVKRAAGAALLYLIQNAFPGQFFLKLRCMGSFWILQKRMRNETTQME